MKKLSSLIIVFVFTLASFYAQEKQFFVSAAPIVDLKNGTITETAYRTSSDSKFSELEWQNKMNWRLGAQLEAGWRFISLEGAFLYGIPKGSASMTESWWTNAATPDRIITQFDCDNKLISDWEINSRLKFDIKIAKIVRIRPYAGFNYSLINFEASDAAGRTGHKKNTSYDDPASEEYKKLGVQVNYKRETYDVVLGLQAGALLFDRLTLLADFSTSPFLYINSIDHHFNNTEPDRYYLDRMKGYFKKFNFGASVEYLIWNGLSAGLRFNYNLMTELTGDEYISLNDSNYTDYEGFSSGTSESSWQLSIYAKYTFRFGPVYVPKDRPQKYHSPKVRKGKVDVIQY